jgi:hypothetical protein
MVLLSVDFMVVWCGDGTPGSQENWHTVKCL